MVGKKHLKRSLGLPLLILYGLGNILGAGIYVLVGKVTGEAGTSAPLAFIIAMAIAGLTAFSYMELSSRYPVSASVSVYLHKAFNRRWLSVGIGLLMVASGIASAAALSQGFAGYLGSILNIQPLLASIGLLFLVGLLAMKGIGESAWVAATFTVLEIAGLLLIIWVGKSVFVNLDTQSLMAIDPKVGLGGIFAGSFLAFYAFIGFEDMVNVSEEAKNPRKSMPLAILFSLLVATILYLAVVIVAINLVDVESLASSSAPLSLVYEKAVSGNSILVSLIGVIAAINGVIVQVIMGSRVLYGLSAQGWIDSRFSRISSKNKTPVLATTVIVGAMMLGTALLPLVSLAKLTSLLVLGMFSMVNISLIIIKRNSKATGNKYFTTPVLVPVLGTLCSIGLIVYQVIN